MTWEDSNSPLIPILNNPYSPQRKLFEFPTGSAFNFRAVSQYQDIQKTGEYDFDKKEVKLVFVPADTQTVTKDIEMDYEVNVTYPTGEKYTVLMGNLYVNTRKGLG
jgi:hypothetical protein